MKETKQQDFLQKKCKRQNLLECNVKFDHKQTDLYPIPYKQS